MGGLSRSDASIGFIKVVFGVVDEVIDQGEDVIDLVDVPARKA